MPEIFNGSYAAKSPPRTPGHNLPVRVTFQFLLVVRPVFQLSGRYSASKLMNSLPQPGQEQKFRMFDGGRFEWLLQYNFQPCT
jgi:hypothetical protein